jgi:hypothetical protein
MGCEMVVKANDGPDGWQGVIFGCNKADIEKNMTKNKMTHYAILTEGAPPQKTQAEINAQQEKDLQAWFLKCGKDHMKKVVFDGRIR